MTGAIFSLFSNLSILMTSLENSIHPWLYKGLLVIFFALCLTLFSLFVWYFYKTLSKKNLLDLNLDQYNKTQHPVKYKFIAILLYLLEYILILPFLILLWFSALSFFLAFTVDGRSFQHVLFLATGLVISIRILSYYNHEIAEDLAKLFPLISLSVFLLSAYAFDLERLISQAYELTGLFDEALIFFSSIFLIEVIMRLFYTLSEYLNSNSKTN